MGSTAKTPNQNGAITQLDAAADVALAAEVCPVDCDDAVGLISQLEMVGRKVAATQAALLAEIDARGLHTVDGHSNVKTMARHVGKLSNRTASGRDKSMRMLKHLDIVAAAYRSGVVGVDQVELLGRVHSNPRVSVAMTAFQDQFVEHAQELSFKDFETLVREWERLADADGVEPANDRNHENRNAKLFQDPITLSWELNANFSALSGAVLSETFERYCKAEFDTDWDKARTEHGEDVTMADLARTDKQRRADALQQIFCDAAGSPDGAIPPGFVHNIVWEADTFEEMVKRLDPDYQPVEHNGETFRCETVDGIKLEPAEAIANATLSSIRRVLIDAKGVTIDLGQQRLFTGNARHAVKLSSTHCVWPGCEIPASMCETDHITEHAKGGATNPENGAVLCGRHNRWKQKNYTISRDPNGEWITLRPDKTRIE